MKKSQKEKNVFFLGHIKTSGLTLGAKQDPLAFELVLDVGNSIDNALGAASEFFVRTN
jgi:hypothetical protein